MLIERFPRPPGVSVAQPRRRQGQKRILVPGSDRQWRQMLPADFLKIPGTLPVLAADARQEQLQAPRQRGSRQRMVADPGALSDRELEALFQDENFLRAIQNDPELRQYVQAEQQYFEHRTEGGAPQPPAGGGQIATSGGNAPRSVPQSSDNSGWKSFKSGLSSMGAGISSKFNAIARSFKKGDRQQSGAPSSDAQYS